MDQLSGNRVNASQIPVTKACNKFDKIIKTIAGFESAMNIEK